MPTWFLTVIMLAIFRIPPTGNVLRCIRAGRWGVLIGLTLLGGSSTGARGAYLLVNSQGFNNVVRFELDSGAASEFARYPTFALPRDLAVDDQGQVYSSTNRGNKNVVKFVPQAGTDVLTAVDFTPNIGLFGPGQIQFHQGDLYVAGDGSRVIYQYDGQTGAEIRQFSVTTSYNIRGMVIDGDDLYYAEIFQNRVRKMDLTTNPPTSSTVFQDFVHLDEPICMAIGGNGNLFIASRESTLISEYDPQTRDFVGVFVDLSTLGISPLLQLDKAITYDPGTDNYFISALHKVYRFSPRGTLLQTYQSSLLQNAYGLVVVPEPDTLALLLLGGLLAVGWRRCKRA